ncbi:MAG: sulfatase-like hydrolase/transferase [Colwellia sp.]|nr:sulfatase-like hydrolase/transferase [Colwellia sp.]MCW8863501.1 sulfatase-like hydrolase/transferase [Colwellia sp.]MCW9079935.1 sulfatase-like hydrolase/transferase [Colwellia sp.]
MGKKYSLKISGLVLWLVASIVNAAQTRPNVIVILADDLGYADVGYHHSSEDVVTPNIDRLAKSGAYFTDGYVTAPVCGPSRVGLITGRYQQRFGYHDNIGPFVRDKSIVQGLPEEIKTAGDIFKSIGYRTGMVGKWHDGDEQQFWPHNRGFEEFFGFNNGAADYFIGKKNKQKSKTKLWGAIYRNDQLVEDFDSYLTDAFGLEAVDYIERHKNEPFFLYVSFNAVHGPLQARKQDLARFKHIKNKKRRTVVAMNYNMDENIGKILDSLQANQLTENTIVFFLSDNGGKIKGNHSYNLPLRGEKNYLWDGGVRIPFAVSWPGHIPTGQILSEPVISLDIMQTALAAAEVRADSSLKLDGVNLLPYLTQQEKALADRYIFWANNNSWSVRNREWKLISNKGKQSLFHINSDMSEKHNLIRSKPEVAMQLIKKYNAWNEENEQPRWGWGKQSHLPVKKGYRKH